MTLPDWKAEEFVSPIIDENMHTLAQLTAFLESLDDALYRGVSGNRGQHSIGKHVRHVIDHYLTFLGLAGNGADEALDYEQRQRDVALEEDRESAIHCLVGLARELSGILRDKPVKPLVLNHNSEGHHQLFSSSVGRELVFLANHTVHHMAIIGLLAEQAGQQVDESFGVNPSTLRYWAQQEEKNGGSKKSACNNAGSGVSVS